MQVFSNYGHFLLKSQSTLIEEEIQHAGRNQLLEPQLRGFTPDSSASRVHLRDFIAGLLSDEDIGPAIRNWRDQEEVILKDWLSTIPNFEPNQGSPNAKDAERYMEQAGWQSLLAQNREWYLEKMEQGEPPQIDGFPSLKVMLYSMYYRFYDPSWKSKPQEVTDVLIAATVPYVDVYITENFQAEILRKVNRKVQGLEELEIATLRDIRSVDENSA